MTNEENIKSRLEEAAKQLLKRQPNLFDFTAETKQSELNIAHHYLSEASKFFKELDADYDLIKSNKGNRRPDIVFHRRGTHELNFLVVEVKRAEKHMAVDLEKIKEYWFSKPLSYRYGASVVITNNKEVFVIVLKNKQNL